MFKKLIIVVCMMLQVVPSTFAYNPGSFSDEEIVAVQGQRPKVDIEVSELTITINADDFIDGVAVKKTTITNEGTVPCTLKLVVSEVPIDLTVEAVVGSDRLHKNESTDLEITVTLGEQQEAVDFQFNVTVEAALN